MKNAAIEFVFVYGTLQSQFNNYWSRFLRQHSVYVSKGKCSGRLYHIAHYPGAVYDETSEKFIHGELYLTTKAPYLFQILDAYEQCTHNYPTPHEFAIKKIKVKVKYFSVEANCYLFNRDTAAFPIIESGFYFSEYQSRY
ncbi:MAG: gamma-glutamylcyclotransferase [Bacteroidales bacterium]|nr:gamma-glutamylcyclotransferase [Bacteroidales bacterium]